MTQSVQNGITGKREYDMQEDEHRKYTRSKIAVAAQYIPEGGEPVDVMVKDLSLHGIMVKAVETLEIGQKCHIRILLGHYKHELPIVAQGSVIRAQGEYFAIKFNTVGFESNESLENLILTHSDDPAQSLSEFSKEELPFDPLSANDLDPTDAR